MFAALGAAVLAFVRLNARQPPTGLTARRELFAELRPVKLANCDLRRYGEPNDGGYLMCENLMRDARAAYSYGIDGRDDWGCDVSQQLRTTVQEYDCVNTTRPLCNRGSFQFHDECIGDHRTVANGRLYDTLSSQLARNEDSRKHLIVKIDVEGDEWASLQATPDSVLARIDQLAIEFHHTDDPAFVETVRKLKRIFYVAHVHANNNACDKELAPFSAWANEALLVNKRIGIPDNSSERPRLPDRLDAPNNPALRDCQPRF